MKIKYCLPIVKNSQKEVLKSLKVKGFDLYEIRLDRIKDLDDKFIADIAKTRTGLIFPVRGPDSAKIISLLINFNVLLDLDFLTQYEEFKNLQKRKVKLILSYHNFKETPKLNYLENLVNKMKSYQPEIIKVATVCRNETDALNLLTLLIKLKQQQLKYIVLGMGRHGLITRIFGALWGNEITFAPHDKGEESAPGQLTKRELEKVLLQLGDKYGRQ